MKVFLSYNTRDRPSAQRIVRYLRNVGAEVLYDRSLLAGMEWPSALEQWLATCDSVVVLLGPHGMGRWQLREAYVALDRGATEGFPVVPILLPGSEPPLGFLALRTWVDLREDLEDPVGLHMLETSLGLRELDEAAREAQHRTRAAICPYRGLLAFREEDAAFYFGRERDVERLREALGEQSCAVVVGASGSGKSSLVQAGLVPAMRQERAPTWEIATMRPQKDPIRVLGALCWPLLEDPESADELDRADWIERFVERLSERPARLVDMFGRVLEKQAGSDRLLLVVDQTEELFTVSEDSARGAFLEAIVTASSEAALSLVLTLRAEFMGKALEDRWLGPVVERNALPVRAMGSEALAAAIHRPAEAVEIAIDPYLPERIVADLEDEPGNLPLLEFALTELWKRSGGTRLRTVDYDAFGGVQNVIAERAESLYQELSSGEQRALRDALLQMVQPGAGADTRRRALMSDIPPSARPIIDRWVAARLLVTGSSEDGRATAEVAHEALITSWDQLQDWVDRDREFLLWQERLRSAELRWVSESRSRRSLWSGGDLAEADRWVAEKPKLAENEFLRTGFRVRRRIRQAFCVGVGLIVGFAIMTGLFARRTFLGEQRIQAQAVISTAASHPDPAIAGLLLVDLGSDHPVGSSQNAVRVAQQTASKNAFGVRFRHTNWVYSARFSGDGRRVVSASRDGTVRVWSADGSQEPIVLEGHTGPVYSARFSGDGGRVVSTSQDGTVRIWSADGSQEPIVLKGHTNEVLSASFSGDGGRVVSASRDGTVRVWSADGSQKLIVLTGHTNEVLSASFSNDGHRVVSASRDGTVRVWSANGSQEPIVLEGHMGAVYGARFSGDGRRVVSPSVDGTVRVWSADGSQEPIVLKGHTNEVLSARFSGDGRRVVSASVDGTVRVWSADGRGEPIVLKGHTNVVLGTSFSSDGGRVVSASVDGTVRVWSADGRGEPIVLKGHTNAVYSARFSSDGGRVVSASQDGTVGIWITDGRREPMVFEGHTGPAYSARFSGDGRHVVSSSLDGTVRVWNTDGPGEPIVLEGHTNVVTSVSFSDDGRRVVSASSDRTVRIWNTDGRGEPIVLKGHTDWVRSARFSGDGRHVVSASRDATVRVWRANGSGEPIVLKGHTGPVWGARFSGDGRHVVSASSDRTVRVWSPDGSGDPTILEGHTDMVSSARFSGDGRRVVSASRDGTVRVWHANGSGEPIVLKGHTGPVWGARFSGDGRHVVSASSDRTVRIWNADGHDEPIVLKGHTNVVSSVSFSGDDRRVVSASWDGTVRVWSADGSGEPIVLEGHTNEALSASFSRDGRRVVSASEDGTIRVWSVSWDLLVEGLEQNLRYCLSENERERYLFETPTEALKGVAHCERRLRERFRSAPAVP